MAVEKTPKQSLRQYRSTAAGLMRDMAKNFAAGSLDEQAVPAYTAGNALSRWVFWKRLAVVFRLISGDRGRAALDFGCGVGVMLPWLSRRYGEVYAVDTVAEPLDYFLNEWRMVTGESMNNVAIRHKLPAPDGISLDLVLALDSLEHVPDPALLTKQFYGLLKAGGRLVVSGPTENPAYRLGRRIIGFTGDYHHRTIFDVERILDQHFIRRRLVRLFYPMTLFRISVYEKEA